jgi:hypothetical protein
VSDETDDTGQADEAGEGIGPPDDDDAGEGLGPPDDEPDPELGGLSEDAGEPPTVPQGSPQTLPLGGPVWTEPTRAWPGSTTPIDLPPPPPPRRRGRIAVIVALVLLVAAGAVGTVLALSGGKTKEKPPVAAPSVAPSPSLVPPARLEASSKAFAVTLHWTQPAGGTPVENYVIYRNHSLIDQVAAGTTTYEDTAVSPGKKYTYELKAKSGVLTTNSVAVVISTPKPAVSEARLSGDFNVKFHLVSSSGFQSLPSNPTAGWHFKPKCKTGPCDVTWSDIVEKSVKAGLNRKGASYGGTDSSAVFGTCSGSNVTSVATVTVKVTKAKGLSRVWRATRFEGTLEFSATAQLRCVSTMATFTVTGTLLQ